jgi:subtilase family serine protease
MMKPVLFSSNAQGFHRSIIRMLALSLLSVSALAQQPAVRISRDTVNSDRVVISGSHSPKATLSGDLGAVSAETRLQGITLVFNRSEAQRSALEALIKAQQDRSSSSYHKWLTPDEFAARFGMADKDIAKVETWLEQQGFSIDNVSRSKDRIRFTGTAGLAETAFGTELHYYKSAGKTSFAPSGDLSVPRALASVVQSVTNLSSFRPRSYARFRAPVSAPKANFTSSQSGNHYLQPGDVSVIYDIKAAYNAGYTGTGQSIAVVGQSSIALSDIENFQNAAGLTVKDPTEVLVPDSGTAAVSSGDEAESDLDLEYSGGIAKGATIYFVYVGNNSNYSVWDSIQYAVDESIAPIISVSYGDCETDLGSTDYATLNAVLEQGAAQGQSIIVASGDDGSTGCSGDTSLTTAQQEALVVDFPASSQYATGMGGTEFPSADVSSSNTTYWDSASGSDLITSALSYIPEQVWNDDSSSDGLSSGGGGVSTFTARPSWQTGVTGITSGSYRLVPDISLDSSPNNAGYLYCSSDSTSTGITGSCSDGFRDSSDEYLTVAGGTSFAAPIFAGMLAIINQKENSTGQGTINSTLYSLAANATTYESAFHDITSGSNECTAGSSYCSSTGESEYPAGTGYDEASGLGSVDLYNLMTSWPASASTSLVASDTTLTAASAAPASGANDTITITVKSGSSSTTTTPTGTLTIEVDGTTETSALSLSGGSATYTFSSTTSGSHVISASYSGDSTYAASTGSVTVTVGGTSTGTTGSFTLAATNITVSQGNSGTSTVTVTSKNSYAGTVGFTVSTGSTSLDDYGCFDVNDATVTAKGTVTTTLTLYTSGSSCGTSSSVAKGSHRHFAKSAQKSLAGNPGTWTPTAPMHLSIAVAFGGFFMLGLRRRRFTYATTLIWLAMLALSLVANGCGGSSSGTSTSNDVAKGTYTLTLDGTDTSDSSITAETTFTLTVQ